MALLLHHLNRVTSFILVPISSCLWRDFSPSQRLPAPNHQKVAEEVLGAGQEGPQGAEEVVSLQEDEVRRAVAAGQEAGGEVSPHEVEMASLQEQEVHHVVVEDFEGVGLTRLSKVLYIHV